MSLRSNPYQAYTRTTAPRAPRTNPEHALQVTVKQYFVMCLPSDVEWSSTLNGVYLGPSQRSKMKASGLRPGPLDIFLIHNRRTYWLELKSDVGRLSEDQKRFISRLHPDSYAVCRTLDEVVTFLQRIGVKLRALPEAALIRRPATS